MQQKRVVLLGLLMLCILPLLAMTLQEAYDNAEPGAGYDKLVILDPANVYTGNLSFVESSYTQNFDGDTFPPEGWANYSLAADTPWEQNSEQYCSPSNCAYHNYFYNQTSQDWLVSPQLEITEDNHHMIFYERNQYVQYAYGYHGVWISNGSGDPNDEEFVELGEYSSVCEDGWVMRTLDLSCYIGDTVYIAFKYRGTYASAWYIDDFSIGAVNPSIKTKIVGNGAVIDLEGSSLLVNEYRQLDIDGAVIKNGVNGISFVGVSAGNITNCVIYDHEIGVSHSSSQNVIVRNTIVMNNSRYGVYKASSTIPFHLSYLNTWNNGSSGSSHYIYYCPG